MTLGTGANPEPTTTSSGISLTSGSSSPPRANTQPITPSSPHTLRNKEVNEFNSPLHTKTTSSTSNGAPSGLSKTPPKSIPSSPQHKKHLIKSTLSVPANIEFLNSDLDDNEDEDLKPLTSSFVENHFHTKTVSESDLKTRTTRKASAMNGHRRPRPSLMDIRNADRQLSLNMTKQQKIVPIVSGQLKPSEARKGAYTVSSISSPITLESYRNDFSSPLLDPKTILFAENFDFALIPEDVQYTDALFLSQIERLKQIVEKEYAEKGASAQFKRDAILWRRTLESPEYPALGMILRRVFCVLRYGGLMYRDSEKVNDWKLWSGTRYPIASALSHGSRVIIQLDRMVEGSDHGKDEHAFWKWLITYVFLFNWLVTLKISGQVDGDLSKFISTKTSGSKYCFVADFNM